MIDFSKLPPDTLVDVMSLQGGRIMTLHFQRQTDNGRYFCTNYTSGMSSIYTCCEWANSHERIRISAKNPWLPWFGGRCPVPDECMVEVHYRCTARDISMAADVSWHSHDLLVDRYDIIAYRLLESPWQTIEGVCG